MRLALTSPGQASTGTSGLRKDPEYEHLGCFPEISPFRMGHLVPFSLGSLAGEFETRKFKRDRDLDLAGLFCIMEGQITVHRLCSPADEPYESLKGRTAIIQIN